MSKPAYTTGNFATSLFAIMVTFFATIIFSNASAQKQGSIKLSVNETNIVGYVEGVRLDSIPGKFLVLETREFSGVHAITAYDVDFGQQRPALSNSVIKNNEGKKLEFNGAATLLNFFDFNGWQLSRVVTSSAFDKNIEIIFERKK